MKFLLDTHVLWALSDVDRLPAWLLTADRQLASHAGPVRVIEPR